MKIHSNPPILCYGFNQWVNQLFIVLADQDIAKTLMIIIIVVITELSFLIWNPLFYGADLTKL